jgi:hypothetical protein
MPVVLFGMGQERKDNFVDGKVRTPGGRRSRQAPAVRYPLGNNPVILRPALRGPVLAEKDVSAPAGMIGQSDDGLARLFVQAV